MGNYTSTPKIKFRLLNSTQYKRLSTTYKTWSYETEMYVTTMLLHAHETIIFERKSGQLTSSFSMIVRFEYFWSTFTTTPGDIHHRK